MTSDAPMTLRVCVTDVWDTVRLGVTPSLTVRQVKTEGLAQAGRQSADPGMYEIKYRGALLLDEDQTLEKLGVPDGAPMIILPARRRPVR
jgi:hypothetical protein